MNKTHFLALIATFFFTLSASAQSGNAYKMVLTLTDGTVVTIGPNDLQNIEFEEGEILATGISITDLMTSIADMKTQIKDLQTAVTASQANITAIQNDMVVGRDEMMARIAAEIALINQNQDGIYCYIDELDTRRDEEMKVKMDIFEKQLVKSMAEIRYSLEAIIDNVQTKVDKNATAITDVQNAVIKNCKDISTNAMSIREISTALSNLQVRVSQLEELVGQ